MSPINAGEYSSVSSEKGAQHLHSPTFCFHNTEPFSPFKAKILLQVVTPTTSDFPSLSMSSIDRKGKPISPDEKTQGNLPFLPQERIRKTIKKKSNFLILILIFHNEVLCDNQRSNHIHHHNLYLAHIPFCRNVLAHGVNPIFSISHLYTIHPIFHQTLSLSNRNWLR